MPMRFPLAESHNNYMVDETWDPAEVRKALQAFMDAHEAVGNINRWSDLAGISKNTLRRFMDGHTQTMTAKTLTKLARAAHASVPEIAGITGIKSGPVTASLPRAPAAALDGDLMRDIMIAVDEAGAGDLPVARKSRLIIALYELALDRERPFNIADPKYDNVVQLALQRR